MVLDRITHVYISDYPILFPSDYLYPYDDLYPVGITKLDNIVEGSMSLDEVLFDNELVFGQLCASKFEVKIYNSPNLSGKYIQVTQENDGVPSFVFSGWIESCKYDNTKDDRTIVAYDLGYTYANMNVAEWWESSWEGKETRTLRELRTSLLDYLGIKYDTTAVYVNDNFRFPKSVVLQKITFADMLRSICELSVVFPHFSRRGNFMEFIQLDTSVTPINLNSKYEGTNSSFEEYRTANIVGVTFYDSENNIKQTVGQSGNNYGVLDTILTLDLTASQLTTVGTNMLNAISNLTYAVGDLKLILGTMDYKLGDYIETRLGNFFVIRNSYSGLQLVEETLTSTGSEYVKIPKSSFDNIITGERWARFKQDVDSFKLEYGQTIQEIDGTLTQHTSSIEQNADSISSEVSRATGAENVLSSNITQTASAITSEVSRATGAENYLSTRVTQTESSLTTKVEKNGVISSINQSPESVTIDADRIDINGTVSANGYFRVDTDGKVHIFGNNGAVRIDDGVLSQYTRDYENNLTFIGFDPSASQLNGATYYPTYSRIFGLDSDSLRFRITTSQTDEPYGYYGWNKWALQGEKVGAYMSYPAGVEDYNTIKLYCVTGLKQTSVSDYSLIPQIDGNLVLHYKYGTSQASVVWSSGTSSKHMKENIVDMSEEEARKLLDVHVVDFDFKEGWNNGQKGAHGVIAEELVDVIPYATVFPPNYEEPNDDEIEPNKTPLPHVNYDNLIPHLIKMVQIQQAEIDELKKRISSLEKGD